MKLCRVGPQGEEKPALLGSDGKLRDLSGILREVDGSVLSHTRLAELSALDASMLPVISGSPRYGVPVAGTSKFICIGLNYKDHAAEANLPMPTEPIIFLKAPSAICGPDDDTIAPINCSKLDWEIELGVIIGEAARNVDEGSALDYVAGYSIVNDVSERAFQMQSSQWDKGKGCDTFGPTGPWLVTRDELPDPQTLAMRLTVNGHVMQNGNSADMIFDTRKIVSYVSRYMTLLPGDIIATGTPAGVGMGQKPDPIWLKVGDVVELEIAGLGRQRQVIRPYPQK
jgi:2-keto-4-pentenoate hydratase/2-oxohepta-3-ene-1,7-dioic acid hydratase in catechol pathway